MGRVVVVGSINSDLVITLERLPRPGETLLGGQFAVHGGGKGANQAMAAARAGGTVVLLGCVGDDAYGRERLAELRANGVDITEVRTQPGAASGVALIAVDRAGENFVLVASGANTLARPEHLVGVDWTPADVVLTQLELPLAVVEATLATARRSGALTCLNAAPLLPAARSLLGQVDVLVVNEVEAADCLGEPVGAVTAGMVARLAALGPKCVVVTLGSAGALVRDGEVVHRLPVLPVTAVDSTGAGDAFCGVLAAGLAAGLGTLAAARRATAAGGLSVTRAGAQSSLPFKAEIEAALAQLPPPAIVA